jgi:hypothetical protein
MKMSKVFLTLLISNIGLSLYALNMNQKDAFSKAVNNAKDAAEAIKIANTVARQDPNRSPVDYGWFSAQFKRAVQKKGVSEQDWYEKVLSAPDHKIFFPTGKVPDDIQAAIANVRDAANEVVKGLESKIRPAGKGAYQWTKEGYAIVRALNDALTNLTAEILLLPDTNPVS